ncbi:MAG TPA: molybdopterin oxidoreductase, partial [Armatimonadota bacterium]|nr:molybdopterin oxidoreductase [Armatimonadota bacterium]
QLYDPDRSQSVRHLGILTTWDTFLGSLGDALNRLRGNGGAGLRLLVGTVTSPTLASQLQKLQTTYPNARIHQHEPVGRENVHAGARMAFGDDANPVYNFAAARTIFSLDCNFLHEEPGSVRYARDFIKGRLVRDGRYDMNRLYVAESTPTITGAKADHRAVVKPSAVENLARALAAGVGANTGGTPAGQVEGVPQEWLNAAIADLKAAGPAALVLAGAHQPPIVHALAFAINGALGSIGKTVTFTEPVEVRFGDPATSLRQLVDDLNAGRVDTLIFLDTNPVYTAPPELNFAEAMKRAKLRVHMGLYDDETGILCEWHVPQSHYLEAWSDARAYDGTTSIVQPLVRPLYQTRSQHEFLNSLLGKEERPGYDLVREYWRGKLGAGTAAAFDQAWHQILLTGVVPNSRAAARSVTPRPTLAAAPAAPAPAGGLEISFRPDPTIWDGRYSNNGWLQELPKHLSVLTWDNAVLISPAMAQREDLRNGDF